MASTNIKGIIFDKDGTLYDYVQVWAPVINNAVKTIFISLNIEHSEKATSQLYEIIGIDNNYNIYKDGTDEKLKIETSFKVFIYFADETPSLYADYIKQFCDQKLSSYKEVKYKNEVEKPWKEYCYERLKSFRDDI